VLTVSGHATLKEVLRYTSAADRKRMGRERWRSLLRADGERKICPA
jgi:hypothetical protein